MTVKMATVEMAPFVKVSPQIHTYIHVYTNWLSVKRKMLQKLELKLRIFPIFLPSDIDECLDPLRNGCAQSCNNTIGTYHCFCDEGFLLETDGYNCSGIISQLICTYIVATNVNA